MKIPRPVLYGMALAAALHAALGAAVLGSLVSATVAGWLLIASLCVDAALGVVIQGQTTPIADPAIVVDGVRLPLYPVAAEPLDPVDEPATFVDDPTVPDDPHQPAPATDNGPRAEDDPRGPGQ